MLTQAGCSHGGRRGTEVREAGIRLTHKLSLQIMCSSAHSRYARFCSGPTHKHTRSGLLVHSHLCLPRIVPTAFCDDENKSYSSGGLDLNMAEKHWRRCRTTPGPWQGRSLARFSSYKARCGPGLEGGLVKCERW